MTQVASFTVTLSSSLNKKAVTNRIFNFAIANLDPPGSIPDILQSVEESLTDTGVDGQRYRRVFLQFTPFTLNTIADATTYDLGVQMARNYRLSKGSIGTLNIVMDSTTYNFLNLKVTDVVPEIAKGILTGNGASAGSAVIVRCAWSLVCADITKQGPT